MTIEEALEIMEARKYICGGCERDCSCKECCTAYNMAIEALEERKTGEWIPQNEGSRVTIYKCSVCGRIVKDDFGYDVTKDYPYCHCGAKMGEVKK